MTTQPRTVNCPTCRKPHLWNTENEFRPFCSERCKLIDLGAWESESYRVPDDNPVSAIDPDSLDTLSD